MPGANPVSWRCGLLLKRSARTCIKWCRQVMEEKIPPRRGRARRAAAHCVYRYNPVSCAATLRWSHLRASASSPSYLRWILLLLTARSNRDSRSSAMSSRLIPSDRFDLRQRKNSNADKKAMHADARRWCAAGMWWSDPSGPGYGPHSPLAAAAAGEAFFVSV